MNVRLTEIKVRAYYTTKIFCVNIALRGNQKELWSYRPRPKKLERTAWGTRCYINCLFGTKTY